ncbi:VOC family protein [Rhodococcus jostii]|uniref:VOC family protein n=1 Tax=Rhodococcus jostii TaxID=132919 RepID=UPI0036251B75
MTNKIDYFEIGSPDPKASKAFYGTLFDRQIAPVRPPTAWSTRRAAVWDTTDISAANWAIFAVHVQNVQATLDHSLRLGATVAIPRPTTASSSSPTFSAHSETDSGSGDHRPHNWFLHTTGRGMPG